MASPRPLSDTPEAIRQRNYRDRVRNKQTIVTPVTPVTPATPITVTPDPAPAAAPTSPAPSSPPPPPPEPASSSGAPWHQSEEFKGPGPDAFASPLRFAPANENAKAEPFAPPAPPAPKPVDPPPTAAEVAPIALAVASYFEAGTVIAVVAYQRELAAVGIEPQALLAQMPTVKEVVRASAERVAIKYRIRAPDELIVVGALGVASFGMVKGRARLKAAGMTDVQPPAAPPAGAAAAPDETPAPTMVTELPIPKPAPAPPREADVDDGH